MFTKQNLTSAQSSQNYEGSLMAWPISSVTEGAQDNYEHAEG
jgi:hypothetical protein